MPIQNPVSGVGRDLQNFTCSHVTRPTVNEANKIESFILSCLV